MIRVIFSISLVLAAGLGARAEEQGGSAAPTGGASGAGARGGNVTATGQTVPVPGASNSAGTTSLDRGVQKKDTDIQGSVCKGC